MDREGRRSMSWSPPKWSMKALDNEAMASSDEDDSGPPLRDKRMHAANYRLEGLTAQASATGANSLCSRPMALLPVKLEDTCAEPQMDLKKEEEHLHGSGWQDPICALFQAEWQDPICTLFQTENLATCKTESQVDTDGSCPQVTPFKRSDASSSKFNFENGGTVDNIVKEKELKIPPKSSQNMTRQNKGTKASEENVSGLLTIRQQIAKLTKQNGAEQLWESDGSDFSDSDIDDDIGEEAILPKPRSPIDLTVEKESDKPTSLCDDLMNEHGFPADFVERAIQELGEGVEYDMLLEYLLHMTAQQDPEAPSTSASCDKRASTANFFVERGYPTKEQASSKKRVSTMDKMVEECGYPTKAVERALDICGTPLWNAEQYQLADLIDFLEAQDGTLNEVSMMSWLRQNVEEDLSTNSRGTKRKPGNGGVNRRKSIVRLNRPSTVKREQFDYLPFMGRRRSSSRMPKVKLEAPQRRNRPVGRMGRPPRQVQEEVSVTIDRPKRSVRFGREVFDDQPLSPPQNLKREQFDYLPFTGRRRSPSRMPKVKLEAHQRRPTHAGRMGRPPRLVQEELSFAIDRHKGSVGFGLPGHPVEPRYLDEDVKGAPFFYFENVASMPNDEWDRIRRHLFDIEPEFVDSLHFSACRRPRGYIHNLPIEGRRKILEDPPMTIQELLPHTKAFWPTWDPRTKLNCITTRMGSEFLIKKLHIGEGTALQTTDPSEDQQREILHLCRHWNLVWTAPNIPTPIDETEIEAMLGFDAGHSRNILSNRSRYKALGNSFSVYTVAFHFSVLKPMYPKGVKVLSLFSGIGGAEVALHKMGINLLVVVSVEIDDGTRRCLEAWWAASKQTGILNQDYHNIKDLGRAQIAELVSMYGGFDLIVGGTPCNNLSGSNHVTRVGLDGKQSTVFFEFSRVVAAVRELTIRLQNM